MRTKTLLSGGIATAALVIALTGCTAQPAQNNAAAKPAATVAASPATAAVKLSGTFAGANGKAAAGNVTITGNQVVLAGYSTDEGPDLHLYLTNGTTEADVAAGVRISAVSFNTASQTFTLPAGVDASKYTNVVVHCDKAKAVFAAAGLSK